MAYISGVFDASFLSSFLTSEFDVSFLIAVQVVSFPFSKTAFPCILPDTKVPESLTKVALVES